MSATLLCELCALSVRGVKSFLFLEAVTCDVA